MPENWDHPSPGDVVKVVVTTAARDEAYRAIGRYMARFSEVVYSMRTLMAQRISGGDGDRMKLAELALGGMTAEQLANPFFGMCRALTELDKPETEIETRLRRHVLDEIAERNNIAHGDWTITDMMEPEMYEALGGAPAFLLRIKPGSVGRPSVDTQELMVEDIDKLGDRVRELEGLVRDFGLICLDLREHWPEAPNRLGGKRVKDVLEIGADRRVHRVNGHTGREFSPHLDEPA
jgi:hypothetical protein